MTIEEFEETLKGVAERQAAHVNNEMFEIIFGGGPKELDAQGTAYQVAKKNGMRIENHQEVGEVWFVRD